MTRFDISAIRRIHIFADTILVSVGWIGAYWLRFALNDALGAPINSFDVYFRSLPLVVVPWMSCCWLFGIYRSSRVSTLVDEFQKLFRGVALGLLVVSSISFFFRELYFGRTVADHGLKKHLCLATHCRTQLAVKVRIFFRIGHQTRNITEL